MTTYDPIERVRQARRQAALVAALAAVLGLLALLLVARLWAGRSEAAAPGSAAADPAAADGGVDLWWRPFLPGRDLPESRSAGPGRHVDGLAAGFARSELGAALAAIHLAHRIDPASGPTIFEPTIREQVVGTDADRLAELTDAAYERMARERGTAMGEPLEPGPARLTAYKVEAFSPDAATITMFTAQAGTPELFAYRLDVRWVDDDWHLVAPAGGNLSTILTRLPALPPGAVALSRGS